MSDNKLQLVLEGVCITFVGILLAFVLFLVLGGTQVDYNGLSNEMDTSVIGEPEPVQIFIDGLE